VTACRRQVTASSTRPKFSRFRPAYSRSRRSLGLSLVRGDSSPPRWESAHLRDERQQGRLAPPPYSEAVHLPVRDATAPLGCRRGPWRSGPAEGTRTCARVRSSAPVYTGPPPPSYAAPCSTPAQRRNRTFQARYLRRHKRNCIAVAFTPDDSPDGVCRGQRAKSPLPSFGHWMRLVIKRPSPALHPRASNNRSRVRPQHLCLEAGHLCGQRADVGGGEGGIEPRQYLTGRDGLTVAHVDRAYDRCLERLQRQGRECDTTCPCAVTTRSTGIKPRASRIAPNRLAMIGMIPRGHCATGAVVIAVDGTWNSMMTGSVGSVRSAMTVLIALDESRGERGTAWTLTADGGSGAPRAGDRRGSAPGEHGAERCPLPCPFPGPRSGRIRSAMTTGAIRRSWCGHGACGAETPPGRAKPRSTAPPGRHLALTLMQMALGATRARIAGSHADAVPIPPR
jgi:hypothetical protein